MRRQSTDLDPDEISDVSPIDARHEWHGEEEPNRSGATQAAFGKQGHLPDRPKLDPEMVNLT